MQIVKQEEEPIMATQKVKPSANTAFARATETAEYLKGRVDGSLNHPKVAVICGSGLGGMEQLLLPSPRAEFNYSDVPHMIASTVPGHASKMVFGFIGKDNPVPVLLLIGRNHFYEGNSMDIATFATRVCKCLGVENLLVTNAAGGLSDAYNVGDVVMLRDHINTPGFAGAHPLRGPNEEDFGVRFPPLSDAYDLALRRKAHKIWKDLGLNESKRKLHEGVYAFVCGPTYETRAEVILLKRFGADLVGMSTIPEVIVARHAGMRVLAMSLVTNIAVSEPTPAGNAPQFQGLSDDELEKEMTRGAANHDEVLQETADAANTLQKFVGQLIEEVSTPR